MILLATDRGKYRENTGSEQWGIRGGIVAAGLAIDRQRNHKGDSFRAEGLQGQPVTRGGMARLHPFTLVQSTAKCKDAEDVELRRIKCNGSECWSNYIAARHWSRDSSAGRRRRAAPRHLPCPHAKSSVVFMTFGFPETGATLSNAHIV
jgi:hypothetical protein